MDLEEKASPFFTPFEKNSVNVISASTNSGKTHLLIQFIRQRKLVFFCPVDRVLVILCNPTVDGSIYSDISKEEEEEKGDDDGGGNVGAGLIVDVIYLEEFDVAKHLEKNALVIFEDVQDLKNQSITDTINVHAHHVDLASVFLVCQSVLSNDDFKILLSLSHNVIIFFSGSAGTKLAQFVKKYFFVNSELKDQLRDVISYSELHGNIAVIQLNQIARNDQKHFFAISGLEHFLDGTFKNTIVYPHLNKADMFEQEFEDNEALLENVDPSTLPKGAYVLVKADQITKKSKKKAEKIENDKTTKPCEKDWKTLNDLLSQEIRLGLKVHQRLNAKNLLRSILKSRFFCISNDGKSFKLLGQDKTESSLIDFVLKASRASGPREESDTLYALFVKKLLESKTPILYIKNKTLWPPSYLSGDRQALHQAQNHSRPRARASAMTGRVWKSKSKQKN